MQVVSAPDSSKTPVTDEGFTIVQNCIQNIINRLEFLSKLTRKMAQFSINVFYKFFSRLTSAISLYAQVQFDTKYPLFDSQSRSEFSFSYAIL